MTTRLNDRRHPKANPVAMEDKSGDPEWVGVRCSECHSSWTIKRNNKVFWRCVCGAWMQFVKLEEEQPNTNMIESNPSKNTKDGLLDRAENLLFSSSPHPATNMAQQEWDRVIRSWKKEKLDLANPEANGPTSDEILAMDKDEREADQLTAKLRKAMGKNWRFRIRKSDLDGKWIAEVSDRTTSALPFFYFWYDFQSLGESGRRDSKTIRCDSRLQAVQLVVQFCIRHDL